MRPVVAYGWQDGVLPPRRRNRRPAIRLPRTMERTSADLRQGVRNLAHRFELPAFWRWWTGELARALPGASRAAVQRRRMRPILAFAPGAAVLWVPRVASGKLELVERRRFRSAATRQPSPRPATPRSRAWRARPTGAASRRPSCASRCRRRRCCARRWCCRRRSRRTCGRRSTTTSTGTRRSRPSSFTSTRSSSDAMRRTRPSASTGRRRCAATSTRRVRQAQAWGATVVAVTPEMPGKNGAVDFPLSRLNLLPAEARTDAAPWRRWQLWLPLGLVLVAVAAAVAVPIWQKRERFIATAKETAAGARAGCRRRRAARRVREDDRRLQLRARPEVRLSARGAADRGREPGCSPTTPG